MPSAANRGTHPRHPTPTPISCLPTLKQSHRTSNITSSRLPSGWSYDQPCPDTLKSAERNDNVQLMGIHPFSLPPLNVTKRDNNKRYGKQKRQLQTYTLTYTHIPISQPHPRLSLENEVIPLSDTTSRVSPPAAATGPRGARQPTLRVPLRPTTNA